MCATGAEHFRKNWYENFAKMIMKMVEISRMSFENFAKEILRKFGNPTCKAILVVGNGHQNTLEITWTKKATIHFEKKNLSEKSPKNGAISAFCTF